MNRSKPSEYLAQCLLGKHPCDPALFKKNKKQKKQQKKQQKKNALSITPLIREVCSLVKGIWHCNLVPFQRLIAYCGISEMVL